MVLVVFFFAAAVVTSASADKMENSLRFGSSQAIPNVDSYFNVLSIGNVVSDAIWDALVYRDPETGIYKGNLATAWRRIDDKTLEFDLREGVKFHNGAPFDADDVVYTFNYVSKPENKVTALAFVRWIDRAEKVSRYKVRIVAKQPFPAAIAYLGSPRLAIYPHDYYTKVGPNGMNEHPIGTGPYRVMEHALGKYIRLQRNGDYFAGGPKARPQIEKVEVRFIADAQTRVAEGVAGGLDLVMDIARDQAEQLRSVRGLKIVSGETTTYSILRMNTLPAAPGPPLKDIRVRRAILHAINRETIAKYLVGEDSRVIHTDCYPEDFGCVGDNVPHYAYDPDLSRRLLAEAGYPNGFDIDLWMFRDRNEAEAIINDLRTVGIRARLRFVQQSALAAARLAGTPGLSGDVWGSGPIFDVSSPVSVHEFTAGDLNRDPEIRDMLVAADTAMNPDARKAAYAKALALIAERAYVVPLYTLPAYYIAAKDLAFKAYPDKVLKFYEMSWK